ncbi:hypothetical protein [Haloferula sp. A504]|uniref:hypothetical protein n=1 Tax=Haloferula sp. A504 TaxID=3373601 RepID=UPI0031C237DF|nr:hypothetical protein [Verrucomicrobiaceae bacterium E54]
MGIQVSRGSGKKGASGSAGCGCFLLVFVLIAWGISALIFPKLPGYDETMEQGEAVPGKVIRVETVENVTINDRHPRRVIFGYGDGQEGSMMLAMDETAMEGQELSIRVMGDQAYPEGLDPFKRPSWLNPLLVAGIIVASLFLLFGILRLLVIGGVLFAAGRSIMKKNDPSPPPPPPPAPPAPPA